MLTTMVSVRVTRISDGQLLRLCQMNEHDAYKYLIANEGSDLITIIITALES